MLLIDVKVAEFTLRPLYCFKRKTVSDNTILVIIKRIFKSKEYKRDIFQIKRLILHWYNLYNTYMIS